MSPAWRSTINLAGIEALVLAAAEKAVGTAAEHVLGESTKVVPIEEGTLSRSGRTDTERDGATVVAAVSYDTPYAVAQHERLDFRHDEGRQAKYLETPLLAEANTVRDIVAAEVRKVIPR